MRKNLHMSREIYREQTMLKRYERASNVFCITLVVQFVFLWLYKALMHPLSFFLLFRLQMLPGDVGIIATAMAFSRTNFLYLHVRAT